MMYIAKRNYPEGGYEIYQEEQRENWFEQG